MASVEMKKSVRRRSVGKNLRTKKVAAVEPVKILPDKLSSSVTKSLRKKTTKRKASSSKVKRLAREEDLKTAHNWDLAIGSVRRRIMMHQPTKSKSRS